MWILLNNAWLSIVEAPPQKRGPAKLVVRARMKGDIERVFPRAKVIETPRRDYRWRAFLPREVVADAIAKRITGIRYRNFKDSVRHRKRHDAYLRVWSIGAGLQDDETHPRRRGSQLDFGWPPDEPDDLELDRLARDRFGLIDDDGRVCLPAIA